MDGPGDDFRLPEDLTIPDDISELFGEGGALSDSLPPAPQGGEERAAHAATGNTGSSDDFGNVAIPDDLSSLTAPGGLLLAALLTPVASAGALAGVCALAGIEADVVRSDTGAIAVLRHLDGEAPFDAAKAISQAVGGIPLVLVTKAEGQIACERFEGGNSQGEIPPGLLLSGATGVTEDLLIGGASLDDLPGVVTSVGLSQTQAMTMIAHGAKRRPFRRRHKGE
jgi:hypothetical protein